MYFQLPEHVERTGVRVNALCPGAVDTPIFNELDIYFDEGHVLNAYEFMRLVNGG